MKRTAFVVTLLALTGIACKKSASPQVTQTEPVVERAPTATPPTATPPSAPTETPNATGPSDPWTKSTAPAGKRDPLKRPLLWAIAKGGKTTYVLGTMHMGIDAEARLPQFVWDKLDAAPVFAMETDLTDPTMIGIGQRKGGGTLQSDLGPVYWKKLEALIEAPVLQGLNKMSPMMAALMLTLRGLPQTPAMDGILLGRAQNQKKQLVYLEPAAKQRAILEKWMDIRVLKMMLDEPDKGIEMSKNMLEAYASGDETKMLALAESQKQSQLSHGFTEAEYNQSMEDMLFTRNASWIASIEKIHAQGNGFVAVGALHLVGKRSVLDLLAAKGYTVTRVTQ
jgi:uncharacterized protein